MLNFFKLTQSYRSLCERYSALRHFLCRSASLVYANELHTPIPKNAVLILPPSDYWTRISTLNVNTEKEAALFAPALFELSDAYRYEAQKIGENSYSLIAYNPTEISFKLQSLQELFMFEKITFAQWVFADEIRPIHLMNGKYLTTLEGIVIEIDPDYIHSHDTIPMDEALKEARFFTKTIPTERLLVSNVTPKTLKMTLVILLIVLGNLLGSAVLSTQESVQLSDASQELLDNSKLPETSIEREAILNTLQKKEDKQLRLRRQSLHISDIPIKAMIVPPLSPPSPIVAPMEGVVLIPGSAPGEPNRLLVEGASDTPAIALQSEGIEEFVYDGNRIKIILNERDPETKEKLKKAFIKKFKKVKFSERGNQLEVRLP